MKLKFLVLLAAVALLSVVPAQAQLTYTSTPALPITDNDPLGVTDTIVVPDNGIITDLNVQVIAMHSWVGDLIFSVEHTDTVTTAVMIDRMGVPASSFGCASDDLIAWIDDEGPDGNIEDTCDPGPPAANGSFVGGDPANPTLMAGFDGQDINGTWVLTVSDNAAGDTGMLDSWTIEEPVIPVELQSFSIE